jgi:hypothetical protein
VCKKFGHAGDIFEACDQYKAQLRDHIDTLLAYVRSVMIKQLKQNSRNQREEHDSHVEQFVIRAFGVVIHDAATQPRVHEDRGQPRDTEFLPDGSDASLSGGVPRFIPVPQEEYFGRDLRQG